MSLTLRALFDGATAPLQGLLALRHGKLWGLAWFPALLGISWAYSAWTAESYFAEGGILGWLAGAGLMGLVVFLQVILALLSPLLDALSARAETLWNAAHDAPPEGPVAGMFRALEEGIRLLVWKLGLVILFSPFLLFDAGKYVWMPLSGFLIAVDFLDYPLSRRRLPFSERKRLFRAHAPAMLGYAIVCNVLLLTPGLGGLAFLPCMLGGTWLMLRCLYTRGPGIQRPLVPAPSDD